MNWRPLIEMISKILMVESPKVRVAGLTILAFVTTIVAIGCLIGKFPDSAHYLVVMALTAVSLLFRFIREILGTFADNAHTLDPKSEKVMDIATTKPRKPRTIKRSKAPSTSGEPHP